ncbi:Unknown protein [Striga hermonthica]|uniref:DUF7769 domain-containing protein n=1 Tax=Striga hermonthica TaxID=68872 RepID=A0A9N7R2E9_STRHE|nr:Unknown protein [Striga hermonthica]
MASNILIDLNEPPYDVEDEVPRSSENIIIELNVDDGPEIGYAVIELDLNQLFEEDDEARSDSSVEETIGQQANDGERNRDIDGILQGHVISGGQEIFNEFDGRNGETGETNQGNVQGRKNRILTDVERWAVYRTLLEKSVNGKLKKNTTKEVKDMFNIELRTVQRIWKIHKRTLPGSDVDVSSRKARNCGRKRIEVDFSRIQQIEWHQRTTLASLSNALGVSYSKLYRLFKRGVLRRHSSAIKPHLKDENKISRLEFCLSMLDESTTSNEPKFKGMYNYVHIDEKWFYLTKKEQTYYLLDNEEDPHRSCQSKNNIAKVMFLAATARPRFDGEGRVVFSGKVGCWAFVTEQPAQRNSRNRQAGTMEMKAITSVKRENVKAFLIEKVIPSIIEKWPRSDYGETIYVQQDNARTHVLPNDPDFVAAASQNGFDIRLTCQPPNSPDLNILDLGYFRAIQSLQQKMCARNIPELAIGVYSPTRSSGAEMSTPAVGWEVRPRGSLVQQRS